VVILRAFLALLAGFATMALLIAIVTGMLSKLTPGWVESQGKPQASYMFVNLGSSFLAAAAGGYVTAWASLANPLVHVLALALVVLALGALSALQQRDKLPIGYSLALVALAPVGVLAGGLLRLRVMGVL
jgi:hypothetical protein